MPEAVGAATPSIPSESSFAGGEGGLQLSDEDILGIEPDGGPSSPAPEPAATPEPTETAAPAPAPGNEKTETPPAPAPAPTTEEPKWMDNQFMRPLFNDKTYGPVIQSMRDSLLAHREQFSTVAEARAVKELLPGGSEELKTLIGKSQEVDQMDLQYFSHDPEEQKGFAQNLYKDDPEAFQGMVQIGLDLIKGQSPQEYAYLTQHLVGESLGSEKVWDWLEYIHEAAQKTGAEEVATLLNQFAGVFQKYGLGPRSTEQDPNLQRVAQAKGEFDRERQAWHAERQREFNADTDKNVRTALDTDIGAQLTKLLPKTSDGLRARIAKDVHSEIESAVSKDAGLRLRLQNLIRSGGINRQTQEQVTNLLTSKARQIMPGAVKRVVNEYTASVMSQRKEVTDKQTAAASRVDVSSGARPGTGVRPLTREEAKSMSFEDILNSSRPAR